MADARLFVGQPRLAEGLQRVLGLPGQGLGFTLPDVRAIYQALDLTEHEYRFAMGIQSYTMGLDVPGVVGAISHACLLNPGPAFSPSSACLIRVRRIIVSNPPAAALGWGVLSGSETSLFTGGLGQVRDTRQAQNALGGQGRPIGRVGTGIGAVTFLGARVLFPNQSIEQIPLEFTLHPGGVFFVQGTDLDQGFTVTIEWDEIIPTSQELNFPTVPAEEQGGRI